MCLIKYIPGPLCLDQGVKNANNNVCGAGVQNGQLFSNVIKIIFNIGSFKTGLK